MAAMMGCNIMRAAAAAIVLTATISYDSPPPRLRDTPTEISPNWVETISQIIGRLPSQSNTQLSAN